MAKTIGGTDGNHMKPDRHPFQGAMRATKMPTASMVGIGPKPGGDGNKISANSAMKGKRNLNTSGEAK